MKRNELFNLKKSLEKALLIVQAEMENSPPSDTECDSKGFGKPANIYAGGGTVERIVFNVWDEIPEEFTVEQVRAIVREKFKAESRYPGHVASRSHAAFSRVLSQWVGDGYLKVIPDSGRYPHTYFKIRKNQPNATGGEK